MAQRQWNPIVDTAAAVVDEYEYLITLRQLHYRLVMTAGLGYSNTESDYKRLSRLTAEGRRAGTFPALLDQTREIHRVSHWTDPASALRSLAAQFRVDRTEGQDYFVVLGGEKATLLAQLESWFSERGVPIVLLRGYGSQTYVDDVAAMADQDSRDAVLVYAGDFDPSGEDILRDFIERCPVWAKVEQVAVLSHQIEELGLVVNRGKTTDSRAQQFIARHGELVQVEVEAIPPDTLRDLYTDALDTYWDESTFEEVLEREELGRSRLYEVAGSFESEEGDDGEDER